MSENLRNLPPEERKRREEALLKELARYGVTRDNFRQAYQDLRERLSNMRRENTPKFEDE